MVHSIYVASIEFLYTRVSPLYILKRYLDPRGDVCLKFSVVGLGLGQRAKELIPALYLYPLRPQPSLNPKP